MKPMPLVILIEHLKSLPGISKKQAEKISYHIINSNSDVVTDLIESISNAFQLTQKCEICGNLSDNKICSICSDKTRNSILIIVETPLDVFKFENTLSINAYYHVLGGLISLSKKIKVEQLKLNNLSNRARNFKEVIIALSSSLEGIVTANYIKSLLPNKNVTQLAQGIPLGAAMEYVDELTLKAAIENRKNVK